MAERKAKQGPRAALDNVTKQLDHVIDQARHKHSQHRSKFKEAIDYLDQIFEDLKKECDPDLKESRSGVSQYLEVDNKGSAKERSQPITQSQAVSQADVVRRPSIVLPSNTKSTKNSSNRITKQPKQDQQSSPAEVIVPPSVVVESEPAEFNIVETIALPKKTDKLDFTRRWLRDDLSSLAHQPPTPIMILPEPCSYYNDVDEHSLGSCSAEVAAINLNGRREKPKKSNGISKVNSLEKPTLIRPQPCRPQPVYSTPERSTGQVNLKENFLLDEDLFARLLVIIRNPSVAELRRPTKTLTLSWRCRTFLEWHHLIMFQSGETTRQAHGGLDHRSPIKEVVSTFASRGASTRGSLRSLPDAGLIIRGRYQQHQQPPTAKDPSLAIDQLCAELELNTEHPLTTTDKRRSFPTSYGHENLYITGNSQYEQPRRVNDNKAQLNQFRQQQGEQHRGAVNTHQSHSTTMNNSHRIPRVSTQQHQPVQHTSQSIQRSPQAPQHLNHPVVRRTSQRQQKSLDEVTNMLNNVVNDFQSTQPLRKRSQPSHALYATPHSTNQSNPFETINQEKINPSRVEAMHNVFERNTAPVHYKWNPQPYPVRLREEDAYHEISEFSNRHHKRTSPPRQSITVHHSPQSYTATEFTPAYPTTQPPSHPPGRNGSATSSQNGGYYSSNSSGISAPAYQNNQIAARRGSIVGHQSVSSRAASVADDEDDGFYDNIVTFDDHRFSRSSEMDVTSLSSHQLPPSGWKPTKIGSFLRKFGGGSRPPGSAASLVSLNKVANETPVKSGNLMKSNSLSNEPWKKMVIDGPNNPAREPAPSKGGFRTRIKNSIFGSKRRLNG
ncbi:hypothetical protein KIN20_006209 [Parelaphostrongylus tenuis]|uniref:Uncharacterized protein n=1 Tax=Parelaphostrongylus tenuis TaxID=148309 RepID=A0AAD5M4E6_PARTN|nr:hypothetical protein KIN20_006209 [Parelaphostrongylus tenuis]